MKVIVFGATGMVGEGVLRECLLDPGVERVLSVGRRSLGLKHPKLGELVHSDFLDFSPIETEMAGYDACFFCLGVSSIGMQEACYQRIIYDITLAAATPLARLNPGMTFIYVTGEGTDSTEKGSSMWARVKGRTENALLRLPFKAAYMFRPGYIQPMDGIKHHSRLFRALLTVLSPLYPLLKFLFPNHTTTTRQMGRAMLRAARQGAPKPVLATRDINNL